MSAIRSALFDAARHEAVTSTAWSAEAARAVIARIVGAAGQAVGPDGLWATHPRDDPDTPEDRYSMLYCGAGGAIWALRELARSGFEIDMGRFETTVPTLVQRNRACGCTQLASTHSWLMGDSGLLLLQWQHAQASHRPAVADRLYDVVVDNVHHPAREMLWGSPCTLLAAVHMAEATGDARWQAIVERTARVLWDEMAFDAASGSWLWNQDMYGRSFHFIGAGHGFAGNVYAVLRAAAWLPQDLLEGYLERAWQTLNGLALRDRIGGVDCINWWPEYKPDVVPGKPPLVQDCHGSPGIVCRLAGAPRTPEWDELLNGAGELTWAAGPLSKGAGLCHGTAGNGYAFLKLWTRTGEARWLDRARAFGMHAAEQVERERTKHGQGWHTLWTGDLGVAIYLRDCIAGTSAYPTLDVV